MRRLRPLIDPKQENPWFAMDIEWKFIGEQRQLVIKKRGRIRSVTKLRRHRLARYDILTVVLAESLSGNHHARLSGFGSVLKVVHDEPVYHTFALQG